jgi:uncharacterized protein DUF4953/uncharacterized protein DUF5117/uncharacterized protein DUF5118
MKRFATVIIVLAMTAAIPSRAQDPAPAPPQDNGQTPPAGGPGGRGGQVQEPRPYDQVITKDAKSDPGVFTVHRVRDRVYYEIPKSELGKEFLWVSQIAKTTLGVGWGGQALGNRVVKWERVNNRVLLKNVAYDVVADKSQPISRAVEAANNDTIIMSFNVEAVGKDEAPVIEVTRLFTSDVPEFSARVRLRARGMDNTRSYFERAASFPQNIEVEATHTYTAPTDPPTGPPNPLQAQGMRGGSATVLMHYSMVKLPEKPMMPRLFDERVGYFSIRQYDYGQDEHRSPQRRYITRYRLEKKDPAAALSEPVKPIVYWIDPATPTKWIPYVRKGIESWQAAFEQAGFRNAIIAKDAPAPEEDPDWSPEDARYSVIRWLPSTTENASGPHIHDPRTGEILEADIQLYHNVMNLIRDWYFVQVAPLDPRAQKLPLPDELMGRLLEFVVAHEVGHTLGFQHNMKASSMYPADKIHDRDWVKKMGHTPTLMDYSRFNYAAQPEDNIDISDLIPGIGPYDKWATHWGYAPIPEAKSPEDEKATLNRWAREQDTTPWLRFSTEGAQGSDPGDLTEAVGDADAVKSSTYGMKNLERVGSMLLSATTGKAGEPYNDLGEIYGRLLGQWVLEMNHVAALIGGFDSQQKHAGQEGVRFVPVPKDRQAAAVKFLNENAFKVPAFALHADVLRRIEPSGALERLKISQQRVLTAVLNPARFGRLVEQEAIDGAAAYKPTDFLGDLRKGIWSELAAPQVKIDAYRRNTQRLFIDAMSDRLNGRVPATDDARAFFRGELRTLSATIREALPRTTDRATRLHLEDAQDQITKALDPKFIRPVTGPVAPLNTLDSEEIDPEKCFPDYAIRLD